MNRLPIRLWPDPILSQVCVPVSGDVSTLAHDMLETMYAAPGRGLAAPQVGHAIRLFVMDATWKDGTPTPLVCINPEIVTRSEARTTGPEGCLSIPGVEAQVDRARRIRLRWTDLGGRQQDAWLEGQPAVIAQHEYDHLDGLVTFDRVTPEARARLEAAYAA